jgi:phosphoglucosamine mutase
MTEARFGTDGIRGVAGEGALAPERVLALGRALGRVLGAGGGRAVLCRDTRRSGPLVSDALASGLLAEGVDVIDAGIRPTPALPHLARAWGCSFGVVISASHNPMEYNGIKVFGPDGGKIPDEVEAEVEREIEAPPRTRRGAGIGRGHPVPGGPDPYHAAIAELVGSPAHGKRLKVVLDCANGASFRDAPALFEGFGFETILLHADPDGDNINEACGALHPGDTARAVVEHGAFAGVALDGDGDRAILADETGEIRDGDFVLMALARRLKRMGKLEGDAVVGTVMCNIGLEVALARESIRLVRTAVGDRNVSAAMTEGGWVLGGEPSGHIISRKLRFEEIPGFAGRLAAVERELGSEGRVVLRYSGTEPVARVMIEGPEEERVDALARELADALAEGLAQGQP